MHQQSVKKKVLILYASPHQNSHTAKLINAFLDCLSDQAYSSKLIPVNKPKTIRPCIDCKACKKGLCPFNEKDMMGDIINEVRHADYVIVASPIYYAGFPSVFKALIDRTQQFFDRDFANRNLIFPQKKPGFLFLTAGNSDPLVNQSIEVCAKMFFECMNLELSGKVILENTDNIKEPAYDFKDILQFFN